MRRNFLKNMNRNKFDFYKLTFIAWFVVKFPKLTAWIVKKIIKRNEKKIEKINNKNFKVRHGNVLLQKLNDNTTLLMQSNYKGYENVVKRIDSLEQKINDLAVNLNNTNIKESKKKNGKTEKRTVPNS